MADTPTVDELLDRLRAANEIISVLRRRIERDERKQQQVDAPAERAISTLENAIDRRTRALLESEARYRALFDHSPHMAFTVDAAGAVTSVNATALRMLEYVEDFVDLPLVELFPEDGRPQIAQMLRSQHAEAHELVLSDGRIVDVTVAKLPGFPGAQVLMRDVSERVALSRELQHSRRLAAIGHLAAGVAHEINNPLTVLQLGLVELREELPPESAAELREFIAHCDRIANIVSNLNTFAEPRPPFTERLLVRDLLRDAKNKARQTLGGIGVMMSLQSRDLSVMADRRQIEQVLVNLLGNAARAMGGKGHVNISGEARGDQVVITISDEGPGIPEERLHQIFTPFVGRQNTPEASFGLGLVLSMSWGLLQENGGSLRATNRPSGGANFEITLPSGEVEGVPESRPKPDSGPGDSQPGKDGLRVLCVEDEAVLQRTLVRLLELAGHQPVGVSSAEAAVSLLDDDPEAFDAVISDLRLPQMSGEELAELVRERHPHLSQRILLMSGFFRDREDIPHFLQKPFTANELYRALARLIRHAERDG